MKYAWAAAMIPLYFRAAGRRYRLREIVRHESLTFYISRTGREICRDDVTWRSPELILLEASL